MEGLIIHSWLDPFKGGGCLYIGRAGKSNINCVSFDNCKSIGIREQWNWQYQYSGGAILFDEGSDNTIDNSKFCNNFASQQGGGIYTKAKTKSLIIRNSLFYGNIADGKDEQGGGAIYLHETYANINNVAFILNQARMGGAIRVLLSDLHSSNSIYCKNTALFDSTSNAFGPTFSRGGAIYIDGACRNGYTTILGNIRTQIIVVQEEVQYINVYMIMVIRQHIIIIILLGIILAHLII